MLKWDGRFLDIARVVSTWSKDPSTKVGAVLVRDRRIISTGYNGFPRDIKDTNERLADRATRIQLTVHAELNCILNAVFAGESTNWAMLYVYGLPPCINCAKAIIQAGIQTVVCQIPGNTVPERWQSECDTAKALLHEGGVATLW